MIKPNVALRGVGLTGVPGENPDSLGKNLSEQSSNKFNPHMRPTETCLGIEPGPSRWEASALPPAPPLFYTKLCLSVW